MTAQEIKEFEKKVYDQKCKTCRHWKKCPWGKKKKIDTCFGVFYIADKRKLKGGAK